MNEDLLYQHYVEIGYNQGYRVCPKIKSYTLSESWLGGDGNQHSSVSTHHFDTYGGCILTESAGTAVNYHSITQYLYHYDENNRPVRIDTFSSIPATGDYYSESQLFRNNELGLCVFQAQVKEMLMGKGAPQIVTSGNYDKYWEYSYDEYGRCIYTYYNDKSVKKSESKTTIDYDVVDTDGNLIHHRIRSWDHVYDINRLAQAAMNGEYAAYVYAQTDGKLMMTFDY